jgi:hypothetical protein
MRALYRSVVFLLGIIGAADALAINTIYSTIKRIARAVGLSLDATHGFLGLGLAILGFLGACVMLKWPIVGGVMLLIAGIGFFFVVGWWALLASPQLLLAGFFGIYEAWNEAQLHKHEGYPETGERRMA